MASTVLLDMGRLKDEDRDRFCGAVEALPQKLGWEERSQLEILYAGEALGCKPQPPHLNLWKVDGDDAHAEAALGAYAHAYLFENSSEIGKAWGDLLHRSLERYENYTGPHR